MNLKKDFRAVGALVSWQTINMLMEMHPKVAKVAGMETESFRDSLGSLISDLSAVEEHFSVKLGPRNNESKKHENFTNNFLISYVEGERRGGPGRFQSGREAPPTASASPVSLSRPFLPSRSLGTG